MHCRWTLGTLFGLTHEACESLPPNKRQTAPLASPSIRAWTGPHKRMFREDQNGLNVVQICALTGDVDSLRHFSRRCVDASLRLCLLPPVQGDSECPGSPRSPASSADPRRLENRHRQDLGVG